MTRPCLIAATVVGVLTLGGCPLFAPFGGAGFVAFEGGAGKLLLVERQSQGIPTEQPTAGAVRVAEIDLATGSAVDLAEGVVALDGDLVAGEDWIAWIDRDAGQVFVIDRQSGKRRALYAPEDAPSPNPAAGDIPAALSSGRLLQIVGDRLIALAQTPGASSECYTLLVFDLPTGDFQKIERAWQYGTHAIEGDLLAYFDCGPSDVPLLGLELRTGLRVTNLTEGGVDVIAPAIRIDGDGEAQLFIHDGVIYWEEFRSGSFRSRVRSYDTRDGEVRDVFGDFSGSERDRDLLGVNAEYAVVMVSKSGPAGLTADATLEIWPLRDGRRETIFESRALSTAFGFRVWMSGDEVIWFDPNPAVDELVIYNTLTKSTRRVATPTR